MKLEKALQTSFVDEKHKALINVMYTSNWVKGLYNEVLQQYEITISQFNILRILKGSLQLNKHLTMNEIKSRLVDNTPNTTRLVNALLKKKYIERAKCEHDLRITYVLLTPSGELLVQEASCKLEEKLATITTLQQRELKNLNKLLEQLRE